MEPSEPPEQKRPSCMGCQDTELASFLWPRKTWTSSRRLRMSKSLSRWSLDAVTSQLPLSFHFRSITVDLWACLLMIEKMWVCAVESMIKIHPKRNTHRVARAMPLLGSQILMGCWLSLLPLTIIPFCGCQCTHLTSAPWPFWDTWLDSVLGLPPTKSHLVALAPPGTAWSPISSGFRRRCRWRTCCPWDWNWVWWIALENVRT